MQTARADGTYFTCAVSCDTQSEPLVYDKPSMSEREPATSVSLERHVPVFGQPARSVQSATMFPDGADLPIFSGTPIPAIERPFVPEDQSIKQAMLPGMPGIDYDAVLTKDTELRRRRAPAVLPPEGDIFLADAVSTEHTDAAAHAPAVPKRARPKKPQTPEEGDHLREALAPYLSLPQLRRLASAGENLKQAFIGSGQVPKEVQALLDTLALILRPSERDQIKSPQDIAALLMVEMGYLDQEHMRVVCLNTKNRVQKIHTVYQGSLNTAHIRVGEIFREPLKLNSAAVILAHNHPSGEPVPSPEDVLVTREIVKAGELLDVQVLDHLVIGQGRWVSLRERGLGFDK
jgi:DNA repair protein RadC